MTADPLKDLGRANKIADAAFTHMRYCNIPTVPDNFRVWFEFFSGDNP